MWTSLSCSFIVVCGHWQRKSGWLNVKVIGNECMSSYRLPPLDATRRDNDVSQLVILIPFHDPTKPTSNTDSNSITFGTSRGDIDLSHFPCLRCSQDLKAYAASYCSRGSGLIYARSSHGSWSPGPATCRRLGYRCHEPCGGGCMLLHFTILPLVLLFDTLQCHGEDILGLVVVAAVFWARTLPFMGSTLVPRYHGTVERS